MSEKFLVYGCGQLAWAEQSTSPFGEDWITGRLNDLVSLEEDLAVSLSDELDGQAGWRSRRDPLQVGVEIHRSRRVAAPLLPTWEDLASQQAVRITEQLRGAGVLVTPQAWSKLPRGRDFLRAWARSGWRWASLEEVLDLKFPADDRIVSAGLTWLRIQEPTGSAVVANGAEAACAVELAPRVLEQALKAAGADLAARWRSKEEQKSGWFTHQQIVRRIAEALRDGRRRLELGTPDAPLFRFSDAAAARRFAALETLQVTVDFPPLSAAIWWEQIAESGFLLSPPEAVGRPAIRWEALETILLGHPREGSSAPPELRSLHTYLRFNGRPLRLVDPATLVEALLVAVNLEQRLARWDLEDRREEQVEPAPTAKVIIPTEAAAVSEASAVSGDSAPPPETAITAGTVPVDEPEPVRIPSTVEPEGAEVTPPSETVAGENVAPQKTAADPLFAFRPDQFYLDEAHHPEHLKVWLDHGQVAPGNVMPARLAEGRQGYQLTGVTVPRGAIVRIDFEPSAEILAPLITSLEPRE